MAEPVSIASGLLTLVTFAAQSSVLLYKTIESYRSHPKNVRDLKEELEALTEVLQTLSKTAERHKDLDLTALKLPLLRCGNTCREFEEAVTKCSSRSGGSKTSFRDWAKLKYMGDGIDEFRRVLAGYKSTINIALADASLRQASLTVEHLESYKVLLNDTTTDLEDHIKDVDDKLQSIFSRAAKGSDEDAMQIQQMQEERLSAKQCLVVCAQLSAHINKIQPVLMASRNRRSADPDTATPAAVAEQITHDGLEGCKDALSATSRRLQEHLTGIVGQMMAASKKSLKSPDEAADLERLQAEWETARLCLDICFRANESVTKVNVNTFENIKAHEEVLQFFASTTGRIVHAKDISLGAKGVQFGGQLSDASIQQITREFGPAARAAPAESAQPEIVAPATDGTHIAEFTDRYGPGFKLKPEAASQTPRTGRPG